MKNMALICLALIIGLVAGCSPKSTIDTTALEKSFAQTTGDAKAILQSGISAINSRDYAVALGELNKLVVRSGLTADQTNSLNEVIQRVTTAYGFEIKDGLRTHSR